MERIGVLLRQQGKLTPMPEATGACLAVLAELVTTWADQHSVDLVADDDGRLHDHSCIFASRLLGNIRSVVGSETFDLEQCCECAAELTARLGGDEAIHALEELDEMLDAMADFGPLDPPAPLTLSWLGRRTADDDAIEDLADSLAGWSRVDPTGSKPQLPDELRQACQHLAVAARRDVAARRQRLAQPDVRGFLDRLARCVTAAEAVTTTTSPLPVIDELHTRALPGTDGVEPAGCVAFQMWADRRANGDRSTVAGAALDKLIELGAAPIRVDQLPERPHRAPLPGEATSAWAWDVWRHTARAELDEMERTWDARLDAFEADGQLHRDGHRALFIHHSAVRSTWFCSAVAASFGAGVDGDDMVLVAPSAIASLWVRSELPLVSEQPAPDDDSAYSSAALALQLLSTGSIAEHHAAMVTAHALCSSPAQDDCG